MPLRIKRVYETPSRSDALRILVDRLWPRGLTRAEARIDLWVKDVAPSDDLRRWYGHDPQKWPEFKRRYFAELDARPGAVAELLGQIDDRVASLVYGTKEQRMNNAAALKEYLERAASREHPADRPVPAASGVRGRSFRKRRWR